jgi:protein-S-isoprenylcysteine O-methyltransferase Ste14
VRPLVYHGGLAGAAFYVAFGLWCLGEAVLQVRTRSGEARDPSWTWMIVGSLLGVGLAFALANADGRLPGPGWAPVAVGLALMVVGMVLRAWSVRTLGRFFRVTVAVEDDQPLVETGPYAALRHPAYTGMLLSCLGLGVALDSWLSVAAALVLPTVGVLRRIGHEEAILISELGAKYESYSRRTKRLVPGIW